MKFATKTIHAAQPSEPETGSLIAPIFQTSTYEQESPGQDKGFNYSRTNNPSRQRLEAVLAELEGVQHAAVFASGLAAENAVFQAYLRLGDDIVVHSVTKYLAGHSDLIQGAALAKDPAIFEPIKFLQNATGAVPAPFDCWLTLRGLKTLELRMQRHEENAVAIAKALEHHP